MARTGIPRLKGENYPFGEQGRSHHSFGELFDVEIFEVKARQDQAARMAAAKKRRRAAGIHTYPPPQESLDLHGCTLEEAEVKISAFMERAELGGLQTVRIITGKGLHSPGGKAVLPNATEQQLRLMKQEGRIVAFQWEKKVKSKSGALLVYL